MKYWLVEYIFDVGAGKETYLTYAKTNTKQEANVAVKFYYKQTFNL